MNQQTNSSSQQQPKAQKGWLSRWTRKQWSRHWFVLKNGSLTYYRGPAAELCSFLDGVLDLSLIKHIEVQQSAAEQQQSEQHSNSSRGSNSSSPTSGSHMVGCGNHQYTSYLQPQQPQVISNQSASSNNNNNPNSAQFTFSLRMWNGECHLLGASSSAERSLWLEAINACISDDETTSTDSAASSVDSSVGSPTSNLSARSPLHYAMQPAPQVTGSLLEIGAAQLKSSQVNSSGCYRKSLATSGLGNQLLRPRAAADSAKNHSRDVIITNDNKENKPSQKTTSGADGFTKRQDLVVVQRSAGQLLDRPAEVASCKQRIALAKSNNNIKSSQTGNATSWSPYGTGRGLGIGSALIKQSSHLLKREEEKEQEEEQEKRNNNNFTLGHHRQNRMCDLAAVSARLRDNKKDNEQDECCKEKLEAKKNTATKNAGDQVDDNEQIISSDEVSEDEDDNQALKRRLISVNSRQTSPRTSTDDNMDCGQHNGGQLKLITSRLRLSGCSEDLYSTLSRRQATESSNQQQQTEDLEMKSASCSSSSSSNSSSNSSSSSSEDEQEDDRKSALTSARQLLISKGAENSGNSEEQQIKQKKRVTFDLSLSSLHQLTSSSGSDASEEDSDCSLSSSASSSSVPESEINNHQSGSRQLEGKTLETPGDQMEPEAMDMAADSRDGATSAGQSSSDSADSRTGDSMKPEVEASFRRNKELELELDKAQASIGQLEQKLSGSYASYNQLEASYKRLQLELTKCDELHKCDLSRMQLKVEELSRELAASQLKLVETRDKLIEYEEHLSKQQQQQQTTSSSTGTETTATTTNATETTTNKQTNHHHHRNNLHQATSYQKLLNWPLKSSTSIGSNNQFQHQPLMLMHHVKHTLAVNQQTLGLKLLNHSKQIQRKLNELELKVDQIQSTNQIQQQQQKSGQTANNANAASCAGSA